MYQLSWTQRRADYIARLAADRRRRVLRSKLLARKKLAYQRSRRRALSGVKFGDLNRFIALAANDIVGGKFGRVVDADISRKRAFDPNTVSGKSKFPLYDNHGRDIVASSGVVSSGKKPKVFVDKFSDSMHGPQLDAPVLGAGDGPVVDLDPPPLSMGGRGRHGFGISDSYVGDSYLSRGRRFSHRYSPSEKVFRYRFNFLNDRERGNMQYVDMASHGVFGSRSLSVPYDYVDPTGKLVKFGSVDDQRWKRLYGPYYNGKFGFMYVDSSGPDVVGGLNKLVAYYPYGVRDEQESVYDHNNDVDIPTNLLNRRDGGHALTAQEIANSFHDYFFGTDYSV
jgi:hypothetical protein